MTSQLRSCKMTGCRMTKKTTALVKVRPAVPAVRKKTANLVRKDRQVTAGLANIEEAKKWIDVAKNGGRGACWGMVTSAVGMAFGLALHISLATMPEIGGIGLILGAGLYGTGLFRKIKAPDIAQLDERLQGINVLYARGRLSKDLYAKAYMKATKDSKII